MAYQRASAGLDPIACEALNNEGVMWKDRKGDTEKATGQSQRIAWFL